MKIAISSGHGKYIRGASGNPVPPQLDEVDEARRVVERVADYLRSAGAEVETFHDDTSHDQSTNLDTIVDWHNDDAFDGEGHNLDVSVHFNAYDGKAHGTEVLWVSQEELAERVSTAISAAGGFTNRGAKYRDNLAVLNGTEAPCILIETCFCDHTGDSESYRANFDSICLAIAAELAGQNIVPGPEPEPPDGALLQVTGRCSWFGGPNDTGVSPSEGLAFIYEVDQAPQLFLPQQPPGTTGLARRLDPDVFYVACRWDYNTTPKDMLADPDRQALVRAGTKEFLAWPADWGPNQNTGRVADISPGLMAALDLETDDSVEVIYPAAGQPQPEPERATVAIQITASGPVTVTINGTDVGEF